MLNDDKTRNPIKTRSSTKTGELRYLVVKGVLIAGGCRVTLKHEGGQVPQGCGAEKRFAGGGNYVGIYHHPVPTHHAFLGLSSLLHKLRAYCIDGWFHIHLFLTQEKNHIPNEAYILSHLHLPRRLLHCGSCTVPHLHSVGHRFHLPSISATGLQTRKY